MKLTKAITICIVAVVLAPVLASAEYLKINPPPDVDKTGGGGVDNSCWTATASNMLAGAGYGNGATVQARAQDIYADMNANFGKANGGWIKNALTWWLGSANNVWPGNPYDNVTSYGHFTPIPYKNANLPRFIGNELRRSQMVGVSITHPGGGHAVTGWGDDLDAGNIPGGTQPAKLIITDSDNDQGGTNVDTYNYAARIGGGWNLNYGAGGAFIKHITTLCPEPEGYLARARRTIHQNRRFFNATDIHFTAYQKEPNVEILNYRTEISEPVKNVTIVEDDWPQNDGKIHSIVYDADFENPVPFSTNVTVDVEFMLNSFNTVRFKDLRFTYDDGFALKATPDLGWAMYGIPRDIKDVGAYGGDGGKDTDQDGGQVQSGFVVVEFTGQALTGPAAGNIFKDTFAHEFKPNVQLATHLLELQLGLEETSPVEIRGLRYGFSPGYFVSGDELAAFDDWIGELGPVTVFPGDPVRLTLINVPEPVSLSLLLLGGPLLLRRKRR